jgi:hypothetical protein
VAHIAAVSGMPSTMVIRLVATVCKNHSAYWRALSISGAEADPVSGAPGSR